NGINICVGQCRGISWRHLLLRPRAHGCWIAYEFLEACIREICDRGHRLAEIRAKGTFAGATQAIASQALRHVDRLTTPSRVCPSVYWLRSKVAASDGVDRGRS